MINWCTIDFETIFTQKWLVNLQKIAKKLNCKHTELDITF